MGLNRIHSTIYMAEIMADSVISLVFRLVFFSIFSPFCCNANKCFVYYRRGGPFWIIIARGRPRRKWQINMQEAVMPAMVLSDRLLSGVPYVCCNYFSS